MAVRVSTYDPAAVKVSVGGIIIKGFAPGRMIEYRLDQMVIRDDEGVDGEAQRWARGNPFATLTLDLSPASDSNFVLGTLLNVDRLTLAAIVPVLVVDRSNSDRKSSIASRILPTSLVTRQAPTRIVAGSGWVSEQPVLEWGVGPVPRRWILRLLNVIHDIHGYEQNVVSSA